MSEFMKTLQIELAARQNERDELAQAVTAAAAAERLDEERADETGSTLRMIDLEMTDHIEAGARAGSAEGIAAAIERRTQAESKRLKASIRSSIAERAAELSAERHADAVKKLEAAQQAVRDAELRISDYEMVVAADRFTQSKAETDRLADDLRALARIDEMNTPLNQKRREIPASVVAALESIPIPDAMHVRLDGLHTPVHQLRATA